MRARIRSEYAELSARLAAEAEEAALEAKEWEEMGKAADDVGARIIEAAGVLPEGAAPELVEGAWEAHETIE